MIFISCGLGGSGLSFVLGELLLLLSLLIHDRLHGWAGRFCTEQNHTAKPNFMLNIYYFDDSGPDRTIILFQSQGVERKLMVAIYQK